MLRALLAVTAVAALSAKAAEPLTVCMAENNPPLSYERLPDDASTLTGLDVRVAEAIADELGRPLRLVPFESKREGDSTLSHEVNALLSSGVCEIASGFALFASVGAPSRPTARVPDHPGAPPPPKRPWVPLGTLVASRAYHTVAMGLVVRDAAHESATLAELGDARIAAVSGTLAGSAVSMYRNGKWRAQIVSLAQNQDALAELEAGRADATLTTLDRLDAWRLAHPATTLRRTGYLHPLRINIGFVMRSDAQALTDATNRVIARATDNSDLPRWTAAAGSTWIAPAEPQIGATLGLMDLLRE